MADMTTKILTIDLNADKAINGIINLNNAIEKNTSDMKANSAMIAENNKKMKESGADVMKLTAQNQVLAQSNVELERRILRPHYTHRDRGKRASSGRGHDWTIQCQPHCKAQWSHRQERCHLQG